MSDFDLDAYLKRIGYAQTVAPDLATLTALHRSHVHAIAFENLEIQMGGSIKLDAETLQAKMVRRKRGGYCFEQNNLLLLALNSIGFTVEAREARVRQNDGGVVRPRTHMVLTVRCEDREWLADAGFGADGLVEPLAHDGGVIEQAGVLYRIVFQDANRVLQRKVCGAWEDLYAVQPESPVPVDFEVGSWFTSTYPRSPFVLTLTAQRVMESARHTLRNLTYSVARGRETEAREISRDQLVPLLRGTFDLDVPEDARFRALDSLP